MSAKHISKLTRDATDRTNTAKQSATHTVTPHIRLNSLTAVLVGLHKTNSEIKYECRFLHLLQYTQRENPKSVLERNITTVSVFRTLTMKTRRVGVLQRLDGEF